MFLSCLAAHMLSSETCMLASQESLSNKRFHNEDGEEATYETISSCHHHSKSVAKKCCYLQNNVTSISNMNHTLPSSEKNQQTSVDDCVGDDKAFMSNHFLDDDSINSILGTREIDCNDNDMESNSIEKTSDQSIASVKVVPIESDLFTQALLQRNTS